MTDNNNRSTLKEAFDAELMKRLEENPPEIPTYEEFSAMVDKSLAERCRRRKRIAGIAAGFVVVLLTGILACTNLTTDVDADKNPKEEIITEDGVIIEDGGWGSSDGEDNVWTTTDWEGVKDAKRHFSSLVIPKYIPNRYIFKLLRIETIETGALMCKYSFEHGVENIIIEVYVMAGGETSFNINNISKELKCSKGNIYIQEKEDKIATIQMNDGMTIINITGNIPDEDIIKIVENLET